MNLREALEFACAGVSVVPGAIYGNSYVCYDDESHGTSDRPWQYVPDIRSKKLDIYSLTDDQLEGVVLFASCQEWEPTSNFRIE
jgi:hypothetical protein